MVDGQVLTNSAVIPLNNPLEWNMIEVTLYNEQEYIIYDWKRIKSSDSFETLKIFVENAIGQIGKWTWNYEHGMLSFKGNTGVILENLLTKMNSLKGVNLQDSVTCPTDDLE